MLWSFAYIALGMFTGISAGMLGIGGGLIMTPVLTMMFAAQNHFPFDATLHLALGTSIATILFTSLSSFRAHHKHGAVLWDVVLKITPGILLGTTVGSMFASRIPSKPLAMFFTFFVCCIAIQMAINFKPKSTRGLPGTAGIVGVGFGIGTISAIIAIGGGAFTVPFLSFCNVRMHNAIGTSAAVGFPIAVGGTLGYIYNGWGLSSMPDWSLGYVYLPALALMVPASMLMAPVGASLTHRLPVATLKRIFACLLIVLAMRMLWNQFM